MNREGDYARDAGACKNDYAEIIGTVPKGPPRNPSPGRGMAVVAETSRPPRLGGVPGLGEFSRVHVSRANGLAAKRPLG
jgi:hypothetical protein